MDLASGIANTAAQEEGSPLLNIPVVGDKPAFTRAIRGHKPTLYLFLVASIAALSSFNYGYHIGVINTPKTVVARCSTPWDGTGLPPCFNISDGLWGTIVAMFAIGGLIGGMIGGTMSDRFGRQRTMLYNNVFFVLGSIFLGVAVNEAMLIVGRIVLGIGAGVATIVVPTYLGEVTPYNLRGAFGVFTQLSITVGILVAQFLSLYMSTVELWRWLFSLSAIVAVAQSFLLLFCVESPRYSVLHGYVSSAERALTRLLGRPDVSEELETMRDAVAANAAQQGGFGITDLFKKPSFRRPLAIAIGLQLAQQFSGINAVFYYSTDILNDLFPDSADRLTVSIGVLNVALTVLSVFLMDRAGRRILLILYASAPADES